MEKKKRGPTVLLVVLVVIIIAALCDDSDDSADSVVISVECRKAFRAAAAVDEMRDTHRDLFPAYSACTNLEEWKNADAMFPDAIDGVDPINYARNVCAGNQAVLGSTTICKAVNTPPPAPPAVAGVLSAEPVVISAECRKAFRAAAAVDEMRDTHRDLFPAYSACTSLEEWKNADAMFPDAIDGVDPINYARNVCAGNQEELGASAICKAVNAPPAARKSSLIASDSTGLLGVPLPRGAELTEEEPGDPASGIDPKEHYSIAASSKDIADFFTRELPAQGWFKSGTSTDTYLFFDKGTSMIGVLIKADGGSFTLMGS